MARNVLLLLLALACAGLGVGWLSSRSSAASALKSNEDMARELDGARSEVMGLKAGGVATHVCAAIARAVPGCASGHA